MTGKPPPTPNDRPATWDLVIADLPRGGGAPYWDLMIEDMRERDRVGRARYGTPLQPHNGRDSLRDAYEEGLDLVVYLRNAIAEGCDGLEFTYGTAVSLAARIRKLMLEHDGG